MIGGLQRAFLAERDDAAAGQLGEGEAGVGAADVDRDDLAQADFSDAGIMIDIPGSSCAACTSGAAEQPRRDGGEREIGRCGASGRELALQLRGLVAPARHQPEMRKMDRRRSEGEVVQLGFGIAAQHGLERDMGEVAMGALGPQLGLEGGRKGRLEQVGAQQQRLRARAIGAELDRPAIETLDPAGSSSFNRAARSAIHFRRDQACVAPWTQR